MPAGGQGEAPHGAMSPVRRPETLIVPIDPLGVPRRLRWDGLRPAAVYLLPEPEPTLIDAGLPGQEEVVLAAVRAQGIPPRSIRRLILTHHHVDHAGGAARIKAITGCEVLAHREDVPFLEGSRPRPPLPWPVDVAIRLLGRTAPPVQVDRALEDGDVVAGLRVVHTPGHTRGHCCLLWDELRLLISGDLLLAGRPCRETPHVFTEDVVSARRSLLRVADLEFDGLLSSHQAPLWHNARESVRELANRVARALVLSGHAAG